MAGYEETPVIVDDFEAPDSWMAVASGLAELKIEAKKHANGDGEGQALRMGFDFKGGGGFVVARKEIPMKLTQTWEFRFRLRGEVPPNRFEFKIVDPSGANVWRWTEEPLETNRHWRDIVIPASRMPFAWGPAGGGVPTEIGAIEFVISAGSGGAGHLLIDRFEWVDTGALVPVSCQASSGDPNALRDPSSRNPWYAADSDAAPWVELDFGRTRELGGMILHWVPGRARDVAVESFHGDGWRPMLELQGVHGRLTPIPLPSPETRRIRLKLGAGAALSWIEWKGAEFSRSDDEFLHAVAAESVPGAFPKYWLRKQTLLTPVGSPQGGPRSMMNEEGMVETDAAGPSLEPFLHDGERLWTWADVTPVPSLDHGWMPLPKVDWTCGDLTLQTFAAPCDFGPVRGTVVDYTVQNHGTVPRRARLHVAIRPFQATPPWQHYQKLGGKSAIHAIEIDGRVCRLNGERQILAMDAPDAAGCEPFVSGRLVTLLGENRTPEAQRTTDPLGWAEAVFSFELELAPGEKVTRRMGIPFSPIADVENAQCREACARKTWKHELGGVEFDVPPAWDDAVDAWRTAAAHILVNRQGAALHPGPRRYNRAWIRDGVVMGGALARAGAPQAYFDFMRWYAPFLREDGFVPCCVDENGADWLIEYDSQGQWLHGIAECHRFGSGNAFAEALWPTVKKCVSLTRALRERRPGEGYRDPQKRPFRGLLPESASHEGYLAHPVHSYWDDFWAIRGLLDIARLAGKLGRPAREVNAIRSLGEAMVQAVTKSLRSTMELRNISYVPGSVEWADFDPSATAVAVMLLDGLGVLPCEGLKETFDKYMEGFRAKMNGSVPWTNYSAYEMRIVSALVRLGRREDAHELLHFLLEDRRPKAWNQWPEITWKDPQSPGHFGDIPHSWIGAEYVYGFASLFAYERASDDTLVLAAGLPLGWFDHGRNNGVENLATYYGRLTYSLRIAGGDWKLDIAALAIPPTGGIEIRLPKAPHLKRIAINDKMTWVPEDGIVKFQR
ncbi:MAG: discoidin domain-containing protein [Luteolibacter sp.]